MANIGEKFDEAQELLRTKSREFLSSRGSLAVTAQRFKAICDNTPLAIIEANAQQVITYCNPAAAELFGYEIGELDGENLSVIIPPEYLSHHNRGFGEFAATGDSFQLGVGRPLSGMRRSGRRIPITITLGVTRIDEGAEHTFYVSAVIQKFDRFARTEET